MGCSAICGIRSTFAMWRGGKDEPDARTRLERKLYLARESPEPEFDLSGCALRKVPPGVYSLCRVLLKHRLHLHDNLLKSLDGGGDLADLHVVTMLNISCNTFSKIPSDIRYLVNLTELNLSHNLLSALPDVIGELVNLVTLDVSHNSLIMLPKSIGCLKLLRVLKLTHNPILTTLCLELHGAKNLKNIELDWEIFEFPPTSIASEGTMKIMMFLCEQAGVPYVPPCEISPEPSPVASPNYLEKTFRNELKLEWEGREAAEHAENDVCAANKLQREKILSEILKDQSELDAEILKLQGEREKERMNLVRELQEEERKVANIISRLMSSGEHTPEVLQQRLQHERIEHDRLLELCCENYQNIQVADTLRAMETMLEEQAAAQVLMRSYEQSLDHVRKTTMLQELDISGQIEEILKLKDKSQSSLIEQLLQDENVQKVAVATLLERIDAQSWSVRQEISIVASNLAKLTAIEQEKRKLEVSYNYDCLLHQRVQLLELLNDLLDQQTRHRERLIKTLKEMESTKDYSTDFWLINYQRLMDSAPRSLWDITKHLDPMLANKLLEEGVIHSLPFLAKIVYSDLISQITEDRLRECGITLSTDRKAVIRAIKSYLRIKSKEKDTSQFDTGLVDAVEEAMPEPTAPILDEMAEEVKEDLGRALVATNGGDNGTECVVCMDATCEMVFTPCGHLCCCIGCANSQLLTCPMCRVTIEKKIKIIIP